MLARGNEGVAGRIKVAEGSIGYIEYHFAKRLALPMVQVQNKAGRFIEPNDRSGQIALASTAGRSPATSACSCPIPAVTSRIRS
jgi:phosphate transport system substrate-binding protein